MTSEQFIIAGLLWRKATQASWNAATVSGWQVPSRTIALVNRPRSIRVHKLHRLLFGDWFCKSVLYFISFNLSQGNHLVCPDVATFSLEIECLHHNVCYGIGQDHDFKKYTHEKNQGCAQCDRAPLIFVDYV
jgi:hypothetical protein